MNNGWELKSLGEICEFINRGISPKYIDSDGLRVLNQKCIRNHRINYDLTRFHDNKAKPVSSEKLIQIGDVLVNSTGTGTLGRVAQVRENPDTVTVDSHVTIVRPLKNLFYNDFFGYALIFIEGEIAKKGEGCGGQTELSRDTLKNDFEIAFPKSLLEQQRIVAILDESFVAIEKAKENAGKNLQNSRELFESYLQNIFENPGDEWKKKKLWEITIVQSGGTPLKSKKEYWNGDIPWYSSGELNDLYTNPPKRKITEIGLNNSNAKIFPTGSLLIGMYDTAALKMSILDRDAAFNQAIAGVKPNDEINLIFVMHAINAIKPSILKERRGVRQKNLNLDKIKNISLFVPGLSEQKLIVEKLSLINEEVNRLKFIYQQKLAALDELKKSMLQKAFNGELTGA